MPRLLTFLICLQVAFTVYASFDYTEIDYCAEEMACTAAETIVENTGCHCKSNPTIREVTKDLEDFREVILDSHNRLRNHMASGNDKNITSGEGIVNVLNYDFELEHLARCWMTSAYGPNGEHFHDKCRKTKTFEVQAGQNLAWRSNSDFVEKKEKFHEAVQMWYDEVVDVGARGNLIDKYGPIPEKMIEHFTQVMWGKATHVACARGCKNPIHDAEDTYNCVVVCNYSAKNEKMNVLNEPVYKRTNDTCQECKCSAKYKALCGEVEPIPKIPLHSLPFDEGAGTLPPGSGFVGPEGAGDSGSGVEEDDYYDYYFMIEENDANDNSLTNNTTTSTAVNYYDDRQNALIIPVVFHLIIVVSFL